MSIRRMSGLKAFIACAAMALVGGCGTGSNDEPGPVAPGNGLPLMVDGLGRQVPEADFGHGDPFAAGAEGVAFDSGPIANAQVTLADSGGSTRTATTDASGYYRIDIKNLQLPFIVKVRRADGTEWFSAGISSAITRGFVPIGINGLTDKAIGYVAEARGLAGGAAASVTPAGLSPAQTVLAAAKQRLRTSLVIPLINAGLNPASYDPFTTPVSAAQQDAAFLGGLTIGKNATGRTFVAARLAVGATGTVATAAPFQFWGGLALDGAGNAYLATENAILKFSPSGAMSVLAGSGTPGFADGSGAAAVFRSPQAVALDAAGNLYVTDSGNYAVRKVSPAGMVTTVVHGDSGFADGQGAAARFSQLTAIVVDAAGNLFVIDENNNSVRKITPEGTVTTIAGRTPGGACCLGSSAVFYQTWLAIDPAGNLYSAPLAGNSPPLVGDDNRVIRKISPAGVHTDVYAPTGNAAAAFHPYAIAVDATGTVYATDASTNRLHRILPDGTATTLAGGTEGSEGIAVDGAGNVLVVDRARSRIRKVTPAGNVSTFAVNGAPVVDGAATQATFNRPSAVAVDPGGAILLADAGNDTLRRISPSGVVTTVAGGAGGGQVDGVGATARFNTPTGVAVDKSGNAYVADSGNNAIRKITPEGVVSTLAGGVGPGFADGVGPAARFDRPSHVAVDLDGNVYVSDVGNASIRRITPGGVVTTVAGTGPVKGIAQLKAQDFSGVGVLAVEPDGTVSFDASCINAIYTRVHACLRKIGANGVTNRRAQPFTFNHRAGMVFDQQSNLHTVVAFNKTIYLLTPAGIETEVASVPGFTQLGGMALDGNGNIVIADSGVAAFSAAPVAPRPAVWIVLP